MSEYCRVAASLRLFAKHGDNPAIAEYYGVATTGRERATTLDYIVAAAGG